MSRPAATKEPHQLTVLRAHSVGDEPDWVSRLRICYPDSKQTCDWFREAKGWNQERFAAEAEIDRSYWHGLEHGRRNITVLKLCHLAKVLGVNVADFFRTD